MHIKTNTYFNFIFIDFYLITFNTFEDKTMISEMNNTKQVFINSSFF